MASPKQSFLQAHWDWLVALGGFAALAVAGFFLMQSLGRTPEDAVDEYKQTELDSVKPANKNVAPADLAIFDTALAAVQKPASLGVIDPAKPNFLASEGRVFCENKDCGKPIPSMCEKCPKCGTTQNVVKIEADADHDGMPNDWEKKYGFNPEDPKDAALDPDGDGFTNLEEFQAGTHPKDKESHPDYLDYLTVAGEIQDTTLEFYFKDFQQIRDNYRFTFQRLGAPKNERPTFTATMNGEITTGESDAKYRKNSGWKVVAFEKKNVETKIAGSSLTRKEDASEVVIQRLEDGKKVTLVIVPNPKKYASRIKTALESRIDLTWKRGDGKTIKGQSEGTTFELNERKYKVVKLKKTDGGPEVTILDLKTKKEKIIH